MRKWEYRVVTAPNTPEDAENRFNRIGTVGWELVCVTAYGMFVFKRIIQEQPK